jgi:signal transduction histidine kinase
MPAAPGALTVASATSATVAALEEAVIILAPFGSDARIVSNALRASGIAALIANDIAELIERVRSSCGSVLVTEEALTGSAGANLLSALEVQPSWSDLPVLLLVTSREDEPLVLPPQVMTLKTMRNVTLLERPLAAITLVTILRSAMQARRRQFEMRDLLARERLAREQAESATRIKDEFLASVSHELRTPLSAVLLWARMLQAGQLNEEQAQQAVRAIASGAEAQSKLIEDLLDVGRMLSGKIRLEVRPHTVAPLLSATVEVLRPMADAKQLRLDVQLEAFPEMSMIDSDRMQQIFWNLLSNAVKFTPTGGRVSVLLAKEGEQVRVTITDTGLGIEADFLPHVFERFRQADSLQTRRHGGLGLGLSIVHQLVELHGGTVQAYSAGHGQGSSFIIRLPIAKPPARSED